MNEQGVADEITRPYNEWISEQHATEYLSRTNDITHRKEGKMCFLLYSSYCKTYFRSWNGNGRLLKMSRPEIEAVAIDVSSPMINSGKKNFVDDKLIRIVEHDLAISLPSYQALLYII